VKRSLIAGTVYFVLLFTLGLVMGTARVLVVAPQLGEVAATLLEIPVMLTAAFFLCRWVIQKWYVPHRLDWRWLMVVWFLALLFVFESGLGVLLFQRTLAEQWATLTSAAGVLGLSAQLVAAFLPLFMRSGGRP
jgi:hypothetical protein